MTISQKSPYLREQRDFPEEPAMLTVELSKSYIDTANAVNDRTIGLFAIDNTIVNGENWYFQGKKQQGIRRVYRVSDSQLSQPHGIDFSKVDYFTRISGTFFDGTQWSALPYGTVIIVNVDATNLVLVKAGGAPSIVKGVIILEWVNAA
jgi:hypothetical protein